MAKPVVYDFFCGLGGWSKGFIAEGYRAVGFDIERHEYGDKRYPGELVLQDVLTLHGRQLRDGAALVASPPCLKYSYMAMPWSRAKRQAAEIRADTTGRALTDLNALFNACFRIQKEASEAAGRIIPLVVENVKGAQPWVGTARAHYGSYYLWGDVESVGGAIVLARSAPKFGETLRIRKVLKRPGLNFHVFENGLGSSPSFHGAGHETRVADALERHEIKNGGGSWFNIANNTESGYGQNPDGRKVPGITLSEVGYGRKAASALIAEIPLDLAQWVARSLLNTPLASVAILQA